MNGVGKIIIFEKKFISNFTSILQIGGVDVFLKLDNNQQLDNLNYPNVYLLLHEIEYSYAQICICI